MFIVTLDLVGENMSLVRLPTSSVFLMFLHGEHLSQQNIFLVNLLSYVFILLIAAAVIFKMCKTVKMADGSILVQYNALQSISSRCIEYHVSWYVLVHDFIELPHIYIYFLAYLFSSWFLSQFSNVSESFKQMSSYLRHWNIGKHEILIEKYSESCILNNGTWCCVLEYRYAFVGLSTRYDRSSGLKLHFSWMLRLYNSTVHL